MYLSTWGLTLFLNDSEVCSSPLIEYLTTASCFCKNRTFRFCSSTCSCSPLFSSRNCFSSIMRVIDSSTWVLTRDTDSLDCHASHSLHRAALVKTRPPQATTG